MTARIKTCAGCRALGVSLTTSGLSMCGLGLTNTEHKLPDGSIEWRPSQQCPKPRWRDVAPSEIRPGPWTRDDTLYVVAFLFVAAVAVASVAVQVWP